MAASAAFLAAMGACARSPATLMRVTLKLVSGGVRVLNMATRDVITPDGTAWACAITDPGVINQPGDFLTSDVSLCSATVECSSRAPVYAGNALGSHFTSNYLWVGASVTMWLWESSLPSWSDAFQVFAGTVQQYEFDSDRVTLSLLQRVDWNRPMVDDFVRREVYPNASDEVVGASLPTAYGRVSALEARLPQFVTPYPFSNGFERIRGGSRTTRGALVEPGRGDAKARVMFASHELGVFADSTVGAGVFIEAPDGKLASLRCPGDSFNADMTGAGVNVPDNVGVAYLSVWPTKVPADIGSGAEDLAVVFDPANEQTFMRVYGPLTTAEHSVSSVLFGSVQKPGEFVSARLLVVYRTYGVTDMPLCLYRIGEPFPDSSTAISGTNDWALLDVDVTSSIVDWATENCYFRTGYVPATGAGIVDISAVALEICYIPDQEKIGSSRKVLVTKQRPTMRGPIRDILSGVLTTYTVMDTIPPEQEVSGKFFANLSGPKDDVFGTYTGTASAIIERPCDIVAHLLVNRGGQVSAQLDTSMTTARDLLKTGRGSDMVMGFGLSDSTDVMTSLSWIARSSAAWFHLSPYSDKWKCSVWGATDQAPGRTLSLDRFIGLPRVSVRPDSSLVTNVRVAYGYDEHGGNYRHEVALAPDRSCAGYKYHQLADQTLEVLAGASDRVDLYDGVNSTTVTLDAADHTFATLLSDLSDKFGVAQPLGFVWSAGFGGVVESASCALDFSDGETDAATLTVGFYSMENYAAEVQRVLNTESTGWSVTYSRTTHKFTITQASGTASLLFDSGVSQATSCAASLGFYPEDKTGSLTYTSDFAVEERLFYLSSDNDFSLRWRSGPNGHIDHNPPYTAHSVLGFVPYDDTPMSQVATGVVPKGVLQQAMRLAVQRYISTGSNGPSRRALTIEGRAIYDTDTALELRNRLAALMSQPRVIVSGLVDGAIGLERGDIVEFDFNTLCPYPDPDLNGSWVDKGLVVTEVVQHMGPDNYGTEFIAVHVLAGTGVGWDWDWSNMWGGAW